MSQIQLCVPTVPHTESSSPEYTKISSPKPPSIKYWYTGTIEVALSKALYLNIIFQIISGIYSNYSYIQSQLIFFLCEYILNNIRAFRPFDIRLDMHCRLYIRSVQILNSIVLSAWLIGLCALQRHTSNRRPQRRA